jgi:hypothetical protein
MDRQRGHGIAPDSRDVENAILFYFLFYYFILLFFLPSRDPAQRHPLWSLIDRLCVLPTPKAFSFGALDYTRAHRPIVPACPPPESPFRVRLAIFLLR